jgi:hypothetical protein
MQARLIEITSQLDQKLQRWEMLLSRSEAWALLFKVEARTQLRDFIQEIER